MVRGPVSMAMEERAASTSVRGLVVMPVEGVEVEVEVEVEVMEIEL